MKIGCLFLTALIVPFFWLVLLLHGEPLGRIWVNEAVQERIPPRQWLTIAQENAKNTEGKPKVVFLHLVNRETGGVVYCGDACTQMKDTRGNAWSSRLWMVGRGLRMEEYGILPSVYLKIWCSVTIMMVILAILYWTVWRGSTFGGGGGLLTIMMVVQTIWLYSLWPLRDDSDPESFAARWQTPTAQQLLAGMMENLPEIGRYEPYSPENPWNEPLFIGHAELLGTDYIRLRAGSLSWLIYTRQPELIVHSSGARLTALGNDLYWCTYPKIRSLTNATIVGLLVNWLIQLVIWVAFMVTWFHTIRSSRTEQIRKN